MGRGRGEKQYNKRAKYDKNCKKGGQLDAHKFTRERRLHE